jgi:thioredoxin 1
MAIAITDQNWEEIIRNNTHVIMDFWAEWCGPCRAIAPFVEEAAQEMEGRALIGKVNIDENPQVTMKFGIKNIPTLIFIRNGEIADKHVGALRKTDLMDKINAFLQ